MAISSIWTIQKESGAIVAASDLGITGITGNFANMSSDTVRVDIQDDYDSDPDFAYGDLIKIYKSGALFFQGYVTSTPRQGTPSFEGYGYTIEGVWWMFENVSFQAEWGYGEIPDPSIDSNGDLLPIIERTSWMSQSILFVDSNGDSIPLSQQITEIFDFAINQAGIDVQLGSLPTAITPWSSLSKDETIAQAIKRCMRWAPDTLMQVDYSTTPPTCNFVSRASASSISYAIDGSSNIVSNSIRSREDLIPSAVKLTYEFDESYDSDTIRGLQIDTAPSPTSNFFAPTAVNVTIPMRSVRKLVEPVAVRTTPIPDNPKRKADSEVGLGQVNGTLSSNSPGGHSWWLYYHDDLRFVQKDFEMNMTDDIYIDVEEDDVAEQSGLDPAELPNGPGIVFAEEIDEPDPLEPIKKEAPRTLRNPTKLGEVVLNRELVPSDFKYDLLDGGLDEWMGVGAKELIITARVYFMEVNKTWDELDDEQKAVFDHEEGEKTVIDKDGNTVDLTGKKYALKWVKTVATNARSKNYNRTTSGAQIEDIPIGLAAYYYNSLQTLQWEGSILQVSQEIENDNPIGKLLNLTQGRTEWQTMDAQIQQVQFDIANGSKTLVFGPAQHLSLQDLIQQLSLEKDETLEPKAARSKSSYDPEDGSSHNDKSVRDYIKPKSDSGTISKGGGTTTAEICYPFDIVTSRPDYIIPPDPLPTIAEGDFEVWVKYGSVNNAVPSNFATPILISQVDTTIYLKVDFSSTTTDQIEITDVTIMSQDASLDFPTNPSFPITSSNSQGLPTHVFIRLGDVFWETKDVQHVGRGSIAISRHLATAYTNAYESQFGIGLTIERLG